LYSDEQKRGASCITTHLLIRQGYFISFFGG